MASPKGNVQTAITGSKPFVTKNPKTGGTVIGAVELTSGWYVFLACGAGVLFSNSQASPLVTGILGIALLVQLTLLLQGNRTTQ